MLNRRHAMTLIAALLLAASTTAGPARAADAVVKVGLAVDRADGIYRCGEKAAFTATVTQGGKPVEAGELTVRVETWLGRCVHEVKLPVAGQPVQTQMTLDQPGFVVGRATYRDPAGKEFRSPRAGVGFDPEKLQPAATMPDDFDAFWEAARKERDAIPMDLKLTPCADWSTDDLAAFKISVANVNGTRARGYLCVPKNRKPPFPVSVITPGAGPIPSRRRA